MSEIQNTLTGKNRPLEQADGAVKGIQPAYPYIWYWRKRLPERKDQLCKVLVRGTMNSALIEFQDGYRAVVSRNALRRASRTPSQLIRASVRLLVATGKEFDREY